MSTKIAVITGGSRGLGRSAALHLAAQGVAVVLTYRSRKDEAEAVLALIREQGGRAEALPLECGESGRFPAFVEALKPCLRRLDGRESFDFLVFFFEQLHSGQKFFSPRF